MVNNSTEQLNNADKQPKKQHHNKGKQWGTPFKPGQSGNPNGRPCKDVCITSRVKELLLQDAGKGKTYADLVAEVIVDGIIDEAGNLKHGVNVPLIRELLDRVEGKVTIPLGTTGEITLTVKDDR